MRPVLHSLNDKVQPQHTVLLVVDMQNDLLSEQGGFARMGLDISHMRAIVPALARLLGAARKAGVLVIYTQVIDADLPFISPAYYEVNLDFYLDQVGQAHDEGGDVPWVDHAQGADFYPPVAPAPDDVVIVKHRFGAFAHTLLDQVLRSNDIKTVVVAGVMTEVCVESTARAALDHDYYVVIPEDCTASVQEERRRASLAVMGGIIGTVTHSDRILGYWANRAPVTRELHVTDEEDPCQHRS